MQTELYELVKGHFNEPVLVGDHLCRCIGYAEDDEDCYMIVVHPRWGRHKTSMVGGYVFLDRLKGQNHVRSKSGEDWDDFTRLSSMLHLSGAPLEATFIEEIK